LARPGVSRSGSAEKLTRLAVLERSQKAIASGKVTSAPPVLRLVLAVVAGLFLWAAQGAAICAWLGAAAYMLAVCGSAPPLAAAAGAIAAALGCFRLFSAYSGASVVLLIIVLAGLAGVIAGALSAVISRRLPPQAFAFLAALLPAGLEQLGAFGPLGGLSSTALTQYAHPIIVCMGRLGGLAGVTYVIFLFGGAVAIAIRHARSASLVLASAAPPLAVVLLGLFYGIVSSAASDTRIHAVAFDVADQVAGRDTLTSKVDYDRAAWAPYVKAVTDQAVRLADRPLPATALGGTQEQKNYQLLVWPEAAVVVNADSRAPLLQQIGSLAKNSKCAQAAAFYDSTSMESVAVITGADGKVAAQSVRHLFISGVDDSIMSAQIAVRGTAPPGVADTAIGRVGLLLSLDANSFANFKNIAFGGAALVCVYGCDDVKTPQASIRLLVYNAALSGLAVVRSAQNGRLAAISPDGTIIADYQSIPNVAGDLAAAVPLGTGRTAFLIFGNAFAWLALLVGIAAGLYASSIKEPTEPGSHAPHAGAMSYKTKEGTKEV